MPVPTHTPVETTTFSFDGTEVGELLSITPPGGKVASVPTTNLSSAVKTFRPGKIPDPGEITLRVQYVPELHDTLAALAESDPTVKAWLITFPTVEDQTGGATVGGNGFITDFSPADGEDEANHEADITIKVTGAITRTAATTV